MLRRIKKQRKLKIWKYLCVPRPAPPIPPVLVPTVLPPSNPKKPRPKKLPYKARKKRRLELKLTRARLVAPELFALFQVFPANANKTQIAAAEAVWRSLKDTTQSQRCQNVNL
jgi:hypothetical protein